MQAARYAFNNNQPAFIACNYSAAYNEHAEIEPSVIETVAVEPAPMMTGNYVIPDEALRLCTNSNSPGRNSGTETELNKVHVKPNLWSFLMIAWFMGVAFWIVRLFWSWRKIRQYC